MLRRTITLGLALSLALVACGDDGSTGTTATTTTTQPTTTEATSTTTQPTTTEATEAPTTTAATTTTTDPGPSALDALAAFVAAAEDLDRTIADAAALFNETWESSETVSPEAEAAIDALDATPLRSLIPAGMTPELEQAVLAVFADLDSRISALHGAVRFESTPEDAMFCLELGATSFRRFDDDLDRMLRLAAASPVPTAAPDSPQAGVLAVRLEAIQSMNWGCDSCGGVQYDEPIPVDWEGRTVMGGVEFEATFDGSEWEILIYAC